MTTLADVNTLVGRLSSLLQQGGPSSSDRDYAEQYAEYCVSVNERLAQCVRMIEEGSSLQALMLAEEKPNLLDAVAALSFAKSVEWHEACALNGLRQAPKIDRNGIHKLNELYNTGSRSEQTKALYREFRGAMATRNDALALDTIRTIARLDPADADAAKELTRIERKRREDSTKALAAALQAGDDATIISWLEQCEKLEVTEAPELSPARLVRTRVRAEEARQEVALTIPTLADLQAQGRWQQCGERASRIVSLAAAHRLALAPGEEAKVKTATAYFESCRAEALKKAKFHEAITAVTATADTLQSGAVTQDKQVLSELEEQRLALRKAYEKAREFLLPIPEALTARVAQIAESLDAEIQRLRRQRKIRNILLIGSTSILLFAAVAAGYCVLRASQFAGELRTLVVKQSAIPLGNLLSEVRRNYSFYTRAPSLQSALLESDAWLEGVAARRTTADAAIAKADALASTDFAQVTPEQAKEIFSRASKALADLPPDVAETLRPQLAQAEGKYSLWLGEQRDQRIAMVGDALAVAREQAKTLASAETAEALREAVGPLRNNVGALVEAMQSPVEELKLPEALEAEISGLVSTVELTTVALEGYDSAMAGLGSAVSLEDYTAATSKLGEVPLPKSEVVRAAQRVAARKLDTHAAVGALVVPGAPELWATIKGPQDLVKQLRPDQTREAEVDRLRNLINDENIAGIYEAVLQNRNGGTAVLSSGGRKIFARGKMEVSSDTEQGTGDQRTTSKGTVYDPGYSAGRLDFREKTFVHHYSSTTGAQSGERVDGLKESDASRALQEMKLSDLVASDASKYTQSILAVVDRVNESRDASPLLKAYAFQELFRISQSRPNAWGLAWAPSFASDWEELRQLASGSFDGGDWMIPAKAPLGSRLADWFKQRRDFSYTSQQALNRSLARAAMEAGLTVCGYIGLDGALVSPQAGIPAPCSELWGLDAKGEKIVVLFSRPEGSDQPLSAAAAGLPLSPLFTIALDKPKALAEGLKAANIVPDLASAYKANLPPFFAPFAKAAQTSNK